MTDCPPRISVTPNPARRGSQPAADVWGLPLGPKYDLVTVSATGAVAGAGRNGFRAIGPDGIASQAVLLPASGATCKVQVRKVNSKTVLASVDVGLTA